MNTSKLWSSFHLRDAAEQLSNFAVNRLHYAEKRLVAKRPDTFARHEIIYLDRQATYGSCFSKGLARIQFFCALKLLVVK